MRTFIWKTGVIACLLQFSYAKAQSFSLLRGLDKVIAHKAAFGSALRSTEDAENRFFYKKSATGYIFRDTDSDLDADNKSYTNIQLSVTGDTIFAQTYTYQMSSGSFVQSATVHGEDRTKRLVYKHIKDDVYVALEDLARLSDSVALVTYLLYNSRDGLYFHSFIYKEERKHLNQEQYNYLYVANDGNIRNAQVSVTYGSRFFYVSGSGLYRKTKKYKLSKQELEDSKTCVQRYDGQVCKANQQSGK